MMDTFTLTHNGTSTDYPLPEVEALLDRVLSAAWRAAKYKMESSVEFNGEIIKIKPERFTYPICDDATKILAHLHHFGLMLDYNPEIPAKKSVAWNEMERYQLKNREAEARKIGIPTFRKIYIMKNNHGGRRVSTTKKKVADNTVAACVTDEIYKYFKSLAFKKDISLSRLISMILNDYYIANAPTQPDAEANR